MVHPDQKYIEALITNDQALIEELYAKYAGKIKWMVVNNNGSEDDAADILQEGILAIYHKARKGGLQLTCPLEAFLYMICKKKWLNVLNNRKNQGKVTLTEENRSILVEDSFLLAEETILHEQRYQLLMEKLGELAESCRELLRLSWSGKSMEEVADCLDFTYGYARKKKSKCMGKLVALVQKSIEYQTLKS
jgi:RNA polymerase sigma factor (sigma-70 family)